MKEVTLRNGETTLVDDEDYAKTMQFLWRLDSKGYVCRCTRHPNIPRRYICLYLHRYLLGLFDGRDVLVDHRDGNPLNNTRANLRKCTRSQNSCNSKRNTRNKTGYKGVTRSRKVGRFLASITINGKVIRIGTFDNPADAHDAYVEAAKQLHGEFHNPG